MAQSKKQFDFSDVNVEMVVSIVGKPIPKQILQREPVTSESKTMRWVYVPNDDPVPVKAGESYRLRVDLATKDKKWKDITKSPYVKFSTSKSHAVQISPTGLLQVRAKALPGHVETSHLGLASIWVEYITPDNQIGFGGFSIDVQPCDTSGCDTLASNDRSPNTKQEQITSSPTQPTLTGARELRSETWPQLLKLPGILVKSGPNDLIRLIVLFDPNCPPCAQLWQRLYRIDSRYKTLPSLWVPVAYMRDDSVGKAAYLLTTGTREALTQNFDGFDFKARVGRAPVINVTPSIHVAIERNKEWWQKIIPATPLILFREADGRAFYHAGTPSSVEAFDALLNRLAPVRLPNFEG